MNNGQSSSLKASFEIELGPLDFNMVSKLGYPLQLPIIQFPQMLKYKPAIPLVRLSSLKPIIQLFLSNVVVQTRYTVGQGIFSQVNLLLVSSLKNRFHYIPNFILFSSQVFSTLPLNSNSFIATTCY